MSFFVRKFSSKLTKISNESSQLYFTWNSPWTMRRCGSALLLLWIDCFAKCSSVHTCKTIFFTSCFGNHKYFVSYSKHSLIHLVLLPDRKCRKLNFSGKVFKFHQFYNINIERRSQMNDDSVCNRIKTCKRLGARECATILSMCLRINWLQL